MGYSQKGRKELDETERLGTHHPPIELLNWGLRLYWSVQRPGTLQDRHQELPNGDFPGPPVVRNLPSNSGDMGSTPGRGRSQVPQSE